MVQVSRDIEKINFYLKVKSETPIFVTHSDDKDPPLVTFPPIYFY